MSQLDTAIDNMLEKVAKVTNAKDSAVTLIRSIPVLIQKAKDDALALGATEAQLASLTSLGERLDTDATELGQAVVDNTPAA